MDFLERNLYGHPLADFLWERQFEENFLGTRVGLEVWNSEKYFVFSKPRILLVDARGRHQK